MTSTTIHISDGIATVSADPSTLGKSVVDIRDWWPSVRDAIDGYDLLVLEFGALDVELFAWIRSHDQANYVRACAYRYATYINSTVLEDCVDRGVELAVSVFADENIEDFSNDPPPGTSHETRLLELLAFCGHLEPREMLTRIWEERLPSDQERASLRSIFNNVVSRNLPLSISIY
jgi:hypothetical protein